MNITVIPKGQSGWGVVGKLVLLIVAAALLTLLFSLVPFVWGLARHPELPLMNLAQVAQAIEVISKDPWVEKGLMWAQMVGFVAAVALLFAVFERRRGWKLGFRLEGCLLRLAEGLGLGFALITVSFLLIWLFGGIGVAGYGWKPGLLGELLGGLLLFTAVAFNEELFSRGYVQGLLSHRWGPLWGIGLSTLLFALLHASNPGIWASPLPFINLCLAGLLLALAREVSGSLWMPIGLHLFWNYFQGYVYGFKVSGLEINTWLQLDIKGPAFLSGGTFGAEGSLVTAVVLLAGIALLAARYPYRRVRAGAR
ncbi:CPBP family intramembrane metalloprotease [Paenibacillus athensensis]|nr:type II CAAX endopeptidase family protein [Paenibacillus athensensis]MCD1260647.1 CPBP family intramembrane metalloprotease [Paenibacillus athensensis]